MSKTPDDLLYTEEHEYLRPAGEHGEYYVGITDYAQGELGDVVFVELPGEGAPVTAHSPCGTIEAVKAVAELFAPLSGEVVEANPLLEDHPELLNSDPYGEGWMIKIRTSDPAELEDLMDSAAYSEHIG